MTRRKILDSTSWLIAALLVALPVVAPAAPEADPFQRYVIIKNELPITIYPVFSAAENQNGCGPSAQNRRMFVNAHSRGSGIKTGESVRVLLPKNPHCWYNAARFYIFTVDVQEFEKVLNPSQKTRPDDTVWNPPLCPNNACWTGMALDQSPPDAPAQLLEYTIDSINPKDGSRFPDANNPAGIPMIDLDLSYVDEVFLPVTMALDDGGATRFMGTAMGYDLFNQRTADFLALRGPLGPIWSQYGAFTPLNWPNNVFHQLANKRTDRVEGGINFVRAVYARSESGLYTPTAMGPKACSATEECAKKKLVGNCCPADDGMFLDCCNERPFLVADTYKDDGYFLNPAVTALVGRWTRWVDGDPCTDLGKITKWPSNNPAFDKKLFCTLFRDTVRFVWNEFEGVPACKNRQGFPRDLCILDGILGFLSGDSSNGRLNQSVQAVQRSVPWGDVKLKQPQYQDDKFILFWADYDSIFNLNPYTRLVHSKTDGLDAPGAYSFSIDDRFGNFQNRASGFVVDVGGKSALPNQEPFDFYSQYTAVWGAGWDHADVCGRRIQIPGKIGSNAPISFWRDGVKRPGCPVILYKSADDSVFAAFRVAERSKVVTDSYTGLQHTVTELEVPNPDYCKNNSSPSMVAAGVCANTRLSTLPDGERAYVSVVPDSNKPLVNLNSPPAP